MALQLAGKAGLVEWMEMLTGTVSLPLAPEQLPDTFVYLTTGSKEDDRVCYHRLKTSDLIAHGWDAKATWYPLLEDLAINDLDDDEQPGSLLLRLGIGAADPDASWANALRDAQMKMPYELRVHVYQVREP